MFLWSWLIIYLLLWGLVAAGRVARPHVRRLAKPTLMMGVPIMLTAACGGGGSDGGGPAGDSVPKCSEVWQAGSALPGAYEGCLNADGDLEAAASYDCVDGSEMFVFGDTFWTSGGRVVEGSADEYGAAFDACKAG